MAGPLARLLARSEALRVLYTLLIFIPISFLALLLSFTGRMALMVPLWHVFAWWMGVTVRVHGEAPPEGTPSVWVANHFNWFDWPMLQVAARYKLYAVVKADIALENPVARMLAAWCYNLGAIFYSRGDRKSGATVRSKISGHSGAVLVFPEGTTQAYGPPMVDIMRNGAIEAAFEARKVLQPAAIYYSARVGLGWELEANGIRQTSLMCAAPMLAAVQLCPALNPDNYKSGEEMASAAKQALTDGYAALEKRYKAWPVEQGPAEQ